MINMDLTVLFKLSYGLYNLGTMYNGKPVGCIVNTAFQITNTDPIILGVSVSKDNLTCDALLQTGRFSLSILSEETRRDVFALMGYRSAKTCDKYEGLNYEMRHDLPVLLENCSGYVYCDIVTTQDFSTHIVFFARITETEHGENLPVMTYDYYHTVLKAKAPKNAPTYQANKPKAPEQWICDMCGFVYEGDLTAEPDDWCCPVCGAPKSLFIMK